MLVSRRRRLPLRPAMAAALLAALSLNACGNAASDAPSAASPPWDASVDQRVDSRSDSSKSDAGCGPGSFSCLGSVAVPCSASDPSSGEDCSIKSMVCVDGLGCRACLPGSTSCSKGIASYCLPDGSSSRSYACDPVQGMVCEPSGCSGPCASVREKATHVGCDFWPTVTANTVWKNWFKFGVLLANPSDKEAAVTITRGEDVIEKASVPPGGLAQVLLPWVDELKGPDAGEDGKVQTSPSSVLLKNGAYRLRSNQPITAMQFSTTQAVNPTGLSSGCPDPSSLAACYSYSNDASLLIPSHSLGTLYSVSGWHSWRVEGKDGPVPLGDFVAVTAIEDNTLAMLTPPGPTSGGPGIEPILPAQNMVVVLNRGDVLQVFSYAAKQLGQWGGGRVNADKPIQVISGSPCANVPEKNQYCDHLEETLLPDSALGTSHVAVAPKEPSGHVGRHLVRIQSFRNATVVEFDPPDVQSPVTLAAGEVFEVLSDKSFEVKSNLAVGVTQFLIGSAGSSKPGVLFGDPSQSVLVPKSHYLKDYSFATSSGFTAQIAAIVVPTGKTVSYQGQPLEPSAFFAIGASGMSGAYVALPQNTLIKLSSDEPFGLQFYGYGPFTSFQLPGGFDLQNSSSK